jgi:lipopolysaccharide/colanic/teichoic acid biosynthesis glycosyltransferase
MILVIISTISFQKFGLFRQVRIGLYGKKFWIYKIRSLEDDDEPDSTIVDNNHRTNSYGKILRKTKMDEIPQLWNVLIGDMSFVGPRPDVPGYADKLTGEDRLILNVRPAITGPATLKYRDEEQLLARHDDPKKYNDEVIWKDKVEINKEYVKNWSFKNDLRILLDTFFS